MKYLLGGLVLLAAIGAGLMFWVRTMPVPAERYHAAGEMPTDGEHVGRGGYAVVRVVSAPQETLAALSDRIAQTPRTTRLAGSAAEGHVSYVTRSDFWGFPDVTNAWIDGDRVAVRGHLVVGGGDMGVNRARIERWLADVPALSPQD